MGPFELIRPYFIERRAYLAAGLFSLLVVDLLQLFIPRIVKRAIDGIASSSLDAGALLRYGGYILLAAIFIGVFRFSWRYCIMGTARRVEEGIRERLFNHVITMPAPFFDRVSAGDIMAHATNDITNIRMALGMGLVGMTDTVVLGLTAVVFMGYINLELTVLALFPMPFIAIFTKILSKRLFLAYMAVQESFSRLMEASRERFAGIRVIKAFNREDAETLSLTQESQAHVDANMHLVRLRGLIFPMVTLLTSISLAVVVGLGGRKVIQGTISPGDFVAFIAYLGLLTWPVMALGWVTNMIQRGKVSIDRINTILNTSVAMGNMDNALTPQKITGNIQIQNLVFHHGSGKDRTRILDNVSVTAGPGGILGIAGPPGAGKTTLVGLIPRIYDPDSGRILIDGMDVRNIDIHCLRRFISFMPQEPFLFSGTILENLKLADALAGQDQINGVIEMAGLTKTIESFPKGINTMIGEKGVMLSGGQKQRIALARALLKRAPILILDDPVSQVDIRTAAGIIDTIEALSTSITVIIVSHRFQAFRRADNIIVLDKGRIVESGNHEQLVAQGGYYARAQVMQSGGES
nr:ABC transporter ATP-binding protein [Desulforapulum autotrophicum]